MKAFKKAVALCLAAVCTFSASVANAYAQGVEAVSRTISFGGESSSDFVTVVVAPCAEDISSLDAAKINIADSKIAYKVIATNDGSYSCCITLPESFAGGRYAVHIFDSGAEQVLFAAVAGEDAMTVLQSVTESNVESKILDNKILLGLDSDVFSATYQQALSNITGKISEMSVDEFLRQYMIFEGAALVKSGALVPDKYFENYGLYIDSKAKAEYKNLTKNEKDSIISAMKSVSAADKSVDDYFSELFLISRIKNTTNHIALKDICERYMTENGISNTKYSSLKDYQKENVFVAMFADKNNMTTAAAMLSAFEKQLGSTSSDKSDNGSSGNDGGGTISGTWPASPVTQAWGSAQPTLSDITGHWAQSYITSLVARGIVSGMEDGSFAPERAVTRAEFAVMLNKAIGFTPTGECGFEDVNIGDWFYNDVCAVAAAGVVHGVDETHFMPGGEILRQDAAVMLSNAKALVGSGTADGFADWQDVSDYAKFAVSAMVENGIMQGSDGRLNPRANVSRAEAAVMISKILDMTTQAPTVSKEQEKYDNAIALLEGLTDAPFLSEYQRTDGVSCGAFASAMAKVMKVSTPQMPNPDAQISLDEAIKLTVTAAGGETLAKLRGGDPAGYRAVAQNVDFLEDISLGRFFDKQTAAVLLYNVMNAHVITEAVLLSNDSYRFELDSELYMTKLYDAYKTEGIIRATNYNSLNYTEQATEDGFITIGSKTYDYADATGDMLGYNAEIVYFEEDSKVVIADFSENETLSISLRNSKAKQGEIEYETEGKTKRAKINNNCFMVYNLRTEAEFLYDLFGDKQGRVVLVDNNDDGVYDIAHVHVAEFVTVAAIDREKMLISDKNDSSLVVNLYDSVFAGVHTEEGERQTLYNIGIGDVLEIYRSHDAQTADITVVKNQVSGTFESIDSDEKTAVIGGVEYPLSDYFLNYYAKDTKLGSDAIFAVSTDGVIVMTKQAENEKMYAYAICGFENEQMQLDLKLLTEHNEVARYALAERVTLNGTRYEQTVPEVRDTVLAIKDRQMEDRLIIIELDGDGKIKSIDTPTVYDGVSDPDALPGNDKLLRYTFASAVNKYRSGGKVFAEDVGAIFNVASAVVFRIPTDEKDDRFYEAGSHTKLIDDMDYDKLYAYDLDEVRSAGAVVIGYASKNHTFTSSDASHVIEKVKIGEGPDGEIGSIVRSWSQGKYEEYYMPDTVAASIVRDDGKTGLFPGDIVRLNVNDGEIVNACVDMYLSGQTVKENKLNQNEKNVGNKNHRIAFVHGVAKYVNEEYATVTAKSMGQGVYDTSFDNLDVFSMQCSYIIRFDRETGLIRPITADEIKTYTTYGVEADYLVLRQRYAQTQLVVVYD